MDLYIDYPGTNHAVGIEYIISVASRASTYRNELIRDRMHYGFLNRMTIDGDMTKYKLIAVEIGFIEGSKVYHFIYPRQIKKVETMFVKILTSNPLRFNVDCVTVEVHVNGKPCKDKTNWWQGWW